MLHVYSAFPGEMTGSPITFVVVGYKTSIFAVTHISLVLLVSLQG